MSKSVKKSPVWTDHHTQVQAGVNDRLAEPYTATQMIFKNGKWYRKLFCSWIICDYRSYKTKQQVIHEWEKSRWLRDRLLTQAEVIKDWEKFYRRK
ncbi:hypothetical protein [Paenibacillus sabinae]|uniref:Uncharacterized protein n=1 Tax=Paenibacillus sabinae T27 TaxID=1268072 RepID=X4ZFV3_9BACL|nr:hypothetical protein [Paenibacillus sabinae]AHV95640.1 hypothetical protein PSAB_03520 [Paenibacillus sabinae T27]